MIKDHIEAHTFDIDTQHKRFLKHVTKDEKKIDENINYMIKIDIKPENPSRFPDPKDPVKLSKVNVKKILISA